jgi:hypothetical protein
VATITNLSVFTRDRSSWPTARAKARRRKRERKVIARKAQRERDEAHLRRP